MEQREYDLSETGTALLGPTPDQIVVFNQWAATALDRFHDGSKASFEFTIDGGKQVAILHWHSNFSKAAMQERRKIAEEGAVAVAMFVMSILLDYKYLSQTEIGEGVDYQFQKEVPTTENFLAGSHYVEISGLLEENGTNTLLNRVRKKHEQINKGTRKDESSSVIITLFSNPATVKELHPWTL
jgi:hypothetical protein